MVSTENQNIFQLVPLESKPPAIENHYVLNFGGELNLEVPPTIKQEVEEDDDDVIILEPNEKNLEAEEFNMEDYMKFCNPPKVSIKEKKFFCFLKINFF